MFDREKFNQDLLGSLLSRPNRPPRLQAALLSAAQAPGKRLRPSLALESSALVGLPEESARTLACAIEWVHLFSLIHDDLPALDDDDWRRGLPTLHRQFDEGTALLAGDELLNLAHECFSRLLLTADPSVRSPALQAFHSAIGGEGMIGGQALELETPPEAMTFETLIRIQQLKTGALFRAAILLPAILCGNEASHPHWKGLEQFAEAFGFAFQIADDLEDEEQDHRQSSKNILSLLGREEAIETALRRLQDAPLSSRFSAGVQLTNRLLSEKRQG